MCVQISTKTAKMTSMNVVPPSTPPICMKTKEFMFFVLYKFLIESFHLSTEKFKKSFEMKISKKKFTLLNILNSPSQKFWQN